MLGISSQWFAYLIFFDVTISDYVCLCMHFRILLVKPHQIAIGNFSQNQYEFLQLTNRCSIEINWHYFLLNLSKISFSISNVVIKIVVEIVSFAFRVSNSQTIEAISSSFLFRMLFHCLTFIAKMTSFALDLNKITLDKFHIFLFTLIRFNFKFDWMKPPILSEGNDLLPLSHTYEWWKHHINHNTV